MAKTSPHSISSQVATRRSLIVGNESACIGWSQEVSDVEKPPYYLGIFPSTFFCAAALWYRQSNLGTRSRFGHCHNPHKLTRPDQQGGQDARPFFACFLRNRRMAINFVDSGAQLNGITA